jgi:polysaccharide biosynthesis transport protein
VTPAFLFQLIWSRRWLIALVTVITVASAWFISTTTNRNYTATTTLVLNMGEVGPFDQATLTGRQDIGYLETQMDIIRSRRVAAAAINTLPEEELRSLVADNLQGYSVAQLQESDVHNRLVTAVLENLVVQTTRDSRVIALAYTSETPAVAAGMANGFANAYIDTTLELSIAPARRNAAWFDGQLVTLRNKLAEKQAALTAYQKDKGIVSYDERLDAEMNRFEALSADLVKAQTRTYEVRAGQLGTQHPEYRRAVEQEQAIRQSLAEQERRVFQVREERDELELLVQDVENARRSYDIALQEYYQNTMESQFNQTNVAILSPATLPSDTAGPNIVVRLIGAIVLGLMLGVLLAIAAELVSRKVRTEDDIRDGLDLRVLASI